MDRRAASMSISCCCSCWCISDRPLQPVLEGVARRSCWCCCCIGLFIPMGWGAPQGTALVVRNPVAIVPDVAGEVIDVPVLANAPLKAGDVLFKIDPDALRGAGQGDRRAVQARQRRAWPDDAAATSATSGRSFDVEQRQSEVDQLKAQLEGAQWNLEKTVVRAPADGYVTNLALRKGARVANLPLAPVMAFIDTSSTIIGVEIAPDRCALRRARPAGRAHVQVRPGQVYTGKVESVLQAIATGQVQTSGHGGTAESHRGGPLRRARQARRRRFRRQLAGRQRRNGCDLHRSRHGRPTSSAA